MTAIKIVDQGGAMLFVQASAVQKLIDSAILIEADRPGEFKINTDATDWTFETLVEIASNAAAEERSEVKGLPVKGYKPTQSPEAIALVDEGKILEERALRWFEKVKELPLFVEGLGFAISGMGYVQVGFMLGYRAVFQPDGSRFELPEDAVKEAFAKGEDFVAVNAMADAQMAGELSTLATFVQHGERSTAWFIWKNGGYTMEDVDRLDLTSTNREVLRQVFSVANPMVAGSDLGSFEGAPITARLENVVRVVRANRQYLSGTIYGDTKGRFKDGDNVTTSDISREVGDFFVTARGGIYRVDSWVKNDLGDGSAAGEKHEV